MSRKALHPGIDPRCGFCAGLGYVVRRQDEVAVATVCECVATCPTCRGDGWIPTDNKWRSKLKPCACRVLPKRIERFNAARIPGRHAASTRTPDSFKPYREVMPAMAAVSRYLQSYRPAEENRGFVLYGDVGRGKTHLLCAMLRELVFEHGVTARFVEFSHLLSDMKAGFDRKEGPSALIADLVDVDVLAIDELGKGRNTEFEGTVVDELVSRRYNAARTVLATTNFVPGRSTGRLVSDLVAGELPVLADRVGARVYSRLREMCDFVPLEGEDYRERATKRQEPTWRSR